MKTLFTSTLKCVQYLSLLGGLFWGSAAWASIPTNPSGAGEAAPSKLSVAAKAELAATTQACKSVCSDIQARLRTRKADVAREYRIWKDRLGVKEDTIMYLRGYSAAEELLKFMGSYYVTRAPEGQMDPAFLTMVMSKCFPSAFVDIDHAKLSGLVDTVWAAKNMQIAKAVNSCK